jgi:YidC/Oxa1 family membrane protein insertase
LSARLFGAPLSAYIISPAEFLEALRDYGGVPTTAQIAWVAVPLMLIASVATHFNSRASIARQSPEAAANPQSAIMNRLSLWIFPAGVLVSGAFLPIGILLYWVSNNVWTVFQQYVVYGRIDKEEAEKKVVALEKRAANAPKPGAKPAAPKKAAPKVIAPQPPKAEAAKEGDAAPVRRAPAVKAKKAGGGQQPVRRPAAKKPSSQANKRKRR